MRPTLRWSNKMNISNFDDLLLAARQQAEPQRLLFVFAKAELPDNSTPEQRALFERGQGGTISPLMSVDKLPEELATFTALAGEASEFANDWSIVFVAGLSGRGGKPPGSAEADHSLRRMIEAVKSGMFGSFIPFDRQGHPMLIN